MSAKLWTHKASLANPFLWPQYISNGGILSTLKCYCAS